MSKNAASSTGGNNSTGNNENPGGGGENPGGQNTGSIEVVYFDENGDVDAAASAAQYTLESNDSDSAKFLLATQSANIEEVKVEEEVGSDVLNTIASSNYSVAADTNDSDKCVVDLKPAYLNTLEEGSHKVQMVTAQGATANGLITIQSADEPISIPAMQNYFYYKVDGDTLYIRYDSQPGYNQAQKTARTMSGSNQGYTWYA